MVQAEWEEQATCSQQALTLGKGQDPHSHIQRLLQGSMDLSQSKGQLAASSSMLTKTTQIPLFVDWPTDSTCLDL